MTNFPARVKYLGGEPHVMLRDIPYKQFVDPFVSDTLARVPSNEIIEPLVSVCSHTVEPVAPRGLIYHVSKCGSTLISQLLRCDNTIAVYSQPPALNDLLMPPHRLDTSAMRIALRALAHRFWCHAGGPYVFKLESWNILFSDIIADAFPGSQSFYCVRDPAEVMVSVMEDPDPPTWFKYLGDNQNPFEQYIDHTVRTHEAGQYFSAFFAKFCSIIGKAPPDTIVIYDELPGAVWEHVAPMFGLNVGRAELLAMQQASIIYSKSSFGDPIKFVADGEEKKARLIAKVRQSIEQYATPAYARILALRSRDSRGRPI